MQACLPFIITKKRQQGEHSALEQEENKLQLKGDLIELLFKAIKHYTHSEEDATMASRALAQLILQLVNSEDLVMLMSRKLPLFEHIATKWRCMAVRCYLPPLHS